MPTLDDLLRAEFGVNYENLVGALPVNTTVEPYQRRNLIAIEFIVLHHTDAPSATTWDAVARYHTESNKWNKIAYHIGVRDYGGRCMVSLLNLPETRSYHAHTEGNNHGLAICVAGRKTTEPVTAAELDALTRAVAVIRRWATWRELPVVGHGDVPGNDTSCPGDKLKACIPKMIGGSGSSSLSALLRAEADKRQVIFPNPNAAIQKRIFADGFVPTSPEFKVNHGGRTYVAQRADNLATGASRVYACIDGDWSNVFSSE